MVARTPFLDRVECPYGDSLVETTRRESPIELGRGSSRGLAGPVIGGHVAGISRQMIRCRICLPSRPGIEALPAQGRAPPSCR